MGKASRKKKRTNWQTRSKAVESDAPTMRDWWVGTIGTTVIFCGMWALGCYQGYITMSNYGEVTSEKMLAVVLGMGIMWIIPVVVVAGFTHWLYFRKGG